MIGRRILVLMLLLCGCAGGHKPVAVAPVDPSTVVISGDLPVGAKLLQRVTVEQCYNPLGPAPARAELLQDLKKKAASIGGNLLRRVSYSNTGLVSSCLIAAGNRISAVAYHVD